ncbi:MAG: hypothetical protein K0R71_1930 [Bacillales bacterium]|jgi:predicted glycoside hydrolase/deacetylase ChbG (UPF0249 family)|nr:hypothetical protein [Bacillales bacterium]
MAKLIINADDFGYSKGVNYGIIDAYQNGILTSTTMMTNMPAAEHAAKLAFENPDLSVGIHFVLTCGAPVSTGVPSLVDEEGNFKKLAVLEKDSSINPEEIEKEYRAQLEKFLSFGLKPSHFDSHHHMHMHDLVYPIFDKLAKEQGVPIRISSPDPNHPSYKLKTTTYFDYSFYNSEANALSVDLLINILKKCSQFETSEIMSHPAFLDQALLNGTSYAIPRALEHQILTSKEVKKAIEDLNIELINYRQL